MTTEKKPETEAKVDAVKPTAPETSAPAKAEPKVEARAKPAKKPLTHGDKLAIVIATLKANGISLPDELDDEDD